MEVVLAMILICPAKNHVQHAILYWIYPQYVKAVNLNIGLIQKQVFVSHVTINVKNVYVLINVFSVSLGIICRMDFVIHVQTHALNVLKPMNNVINAMKKKGLL